MTCHAKAIAGGKVVIPADLRREFGIKDGDAPVTGRGDDGGLIVKTFDQAIFDLQRRAGDVGDRRLGMLRLRRRAWCGDRPMAAAGRALGIDARLIR